MLVDFYVLGHDLRILFYLFLLLCVSKVLQKILFWGVGTWHVPRQPWEDGGGQERAIGTFYNVGYDMIWKVSS